MHAQKNPSNLCIPSNNTFEIETVMDIMLRLIFSLIASSIGIFIFGVHSENSRLRATRIDLLKWLIPIFCIGALIEIIFGSPYGYLDELIFFAFNTLISYPLAQTITRRCRDAGWAKSAAYACVIPYLGLFICLILLFKRSEPGPLRS